MKNVICLVVVCVMAVANVTSADNIRGINMDFVTIGNAGNAADTGGTPGWGSVGYDYNIGKYEVTNAQWNAFTAAAGTPGNGGRENRVAYYTGDQQPTNNVSWYEAAQFCNYLTSGDKSKGVYQLPHSWDIYNTDIVSVNRAAAQATYGTIYFLPTVDEWHKAAYYKPDGSGYSLYAFGTNTEPSRSQSRWGSYSPWNVGTGTQEQNATFDMTGNVWEWNETIIGYSNYAGPMYGLRGGSFNDSDQYITSGMVMSYYPQDENTSFGFRVASVPEPATLLLMGLGGVLVRKHKRERYFGKKRK